VKTLRTVAELAAWRASAGLDVGFVPTMGGLHEGHEALMEVARRAHACVIASIYVNPKQFGPEEDFSQYPRTEERDLERLAQASVDAVFLPREEDMYPRGRDQQTEVFVPGLSDELCGVWRPGHFRGVTTVVARLLGLVSPRACYLGKKDYQQWRLIERMAADLALPVAIVGVPTVREADGLALSTRNRYLRPDERKIAAFLYQTLQAGRAEIWAGLPLPTVEEGCMARLRQVGFGPEYVAIRRADDLQGVSADDRQLVILAAARLAATRLIDNLELERSVALDGGDLQYGRKTG